MTLTRGEKYVQLKDIGGLKQSVPSPLDATDFSLSDTQVEELYKGKCRVLYPCSWQWLRQDNFSFLELLGYY